MPPPLSALYQIYTSNSVPLIQMAAKAKHKQVSLNDISSWSTGQNLN